MTALATATKEDSALYPLAPLSTAQGEILRALTWLVVAVLTRAFFVARAEGLLEHDQSIVGLMALDISAGRRLPIFFDGQRYMGAVEAYFAAAFVGLFGHSPTIVALAPAFFFGCFAAGQYLVWRSWSGRSTGHWAALFTVVGAPMFVLWSMIPRGGYVELLAWAILTLGVYRGLIRAGASQVSPLGQVGWGWLLGFGYFLNPLSLIVYLTMAVDWTFGRHGMDMRHGRGLSGRLIDSRWAPLVWFASLSGWLFALAFFCHIKQGWQKGESPYLFNEGLFPKPIAPIVGVLGLAGLLGWGGWWTGMAGRVWRLVTSHVWFALGVMLALTPFVLYNLRIWLGTAPGIPSLPMWIRAPWEIGPNLNDGVSALGQLVGCAPDALETVLFDSGIQPPPHRWPLITRALVILSPMVVAVVGCLLVCVVWHDRRAWRDYRALRGRQPTPPTVLALTGLAVTAALYLLQASCHNASSVRYLIPVWIFLPGLLAAGLRVLPRFGRYGVAAFLLAAWLMALINLGVEINRPSPLRALARELERREVSAVVAEAPLAQMIANLTHGQTGTLEYSPRWVRIGDRYAARFHAGRPLLCVLDRQLRWPQNQDDEGVFIPELSERVRDLAARYPDRVRPAWGCGRFEVWEVDLPVREIFPKGASPLPSASPSAKVEGKPSTPPGPDGT